MSRTVSKLQDEIGCPTISGQGLSDILALGLEGVNFFSLDGVDLILSLTVLGEESLLVCCRTKTELVFTREGLATFMLDFLSWFHKKVW